MLEKILPIESIAQKQRVLEVGFGFQPAIKSGGTLFESHSVEYVGIEFLHGLCQPFDRASLLAASADFLPFKNTSFDYVLMRSMFGQFIDFPKYSPEPYNFDSIRDGGVKEAFRVLKPGGQFVILEENTPWNSSLVKEYLKIAGFSIKDFAEMEGDYDKLGIGSKWKKLREPFFNIPIYRSPFFDNPYILIGEKPNA